MTFILHFKIFTIYYTMFCIFRRDLEIKILLCISLHCGEHGHCLDRASPANTFPAAVEICSMASLLLNLHKLSSNDTIYSNLNNNTVAGSLRKWTGSLVLKLSYDSSSALFL